MINIGRINRLTVHKIQGDRIYLGSGKSALVLLTDKKPPGECRIGNALSVLVYVDSAGHLAATTEKPKAEVGDVAWLKVVSVNYYGAFLDWGVPKDLLVPFSEQREEMEEGRSYLVKLLLDQKNRILATTKLDSLIREEAAGLSEGQKVSLVVAERTELGFKAIVENEWWGLLYHNELFQTVAIGQKLEGFVKHLRDDGKLDLALHQPGYERIDQLAKNILAQLKQNEGQLPLSDKSPPESIYAAFGVSKKAYKQAIGALYKQQLIAIDDGGIRLI